MTRRIHLEPQLAVDELEQRYRAAREPHERGWWLILWLLANLCYGKAGCMLMWAVSVERTWEWMCQPVAT
jgi:hypothetical protein